MYRLTQNGTKEIVYDIFSHVLHLLRQDPDVNFTNILLWCSLVSKEWAIFTIPLLYKSLDLRLGYAYYGIFRTAEERIKVIKLLQVLGSDSSYFLYQNFVKHLTVSASVVVPYKIGNKINIEDWITSLKSEGFEPLKLSSFWNLTSVEVTRRHSRKVDFMSKESHLIVISTILETLPYLEKLALFGFWLYQLPSHLQKFQCTTYLPADMSSFTICLKNLSSLEELDLTFTDDLSNTIRPFEILDWKGFKMSSNSFSIKKFHLAIATTQCLPGYFNPRSISILLRYITECRKIQTLSLHHVNIQLQDIIKLSSAMTTLQDLQLSIPSTIGSYKKWDNGWEEFKSFLCQNSKIKKVYFLEPETLLFRHIQTGLRIQYKMELDEEFSFDEAFQWSKEDFIEYTSKIRRFGMSRCGLSLIYKSLSMTRLEE